MGGLHQTHLGAVRADSEVRPPIRPKIALLALGRATALRSRAEGTFFYSAFWLFSVRHFAINP